MATSHRLPRTVERTGTAAVADGGLRLLLLAAVIGIGAVLFALALLPTVGAAGKSVQRFSDELNRIGGNVDLNFPRLPLRSTIYAADGKTVLATVFLDENRKVVRLGRMGELVKHAVLSIEDARFYDHPGLDFQGILRALVANVQSGEIEQGASTITQQLARNAFGTAVCGETDLKRGEPCTERTLARKLAEAKVAIRLEEEYSKDEILEIYLNEVYLGRGVYGIGTAAEFYFGKQAKDLKLGEAAMLAGLLAGPEEFSPVNDKDAALARRDVVLDRMAAVGCIRGAGCVTEAQVEAAKATKLNVHVRDIAEEQKAPFFVAYLKHQILTGDDRFGDTFRARKRTLFQGGLEIHTTLQPRLQNAGDRIAKQWLPDPQHPETAFAAVDPKSGAIKALASSTNFEDSQVNLTTGAGGTGRQSGSAFKMFTLVAAFEQGIPPTTVYNGRSGQEVDCGSAGTYVVNNAGDGGGGVMPVSAATPASVNAVFVQLSVDAGLENVVEVAHRMGIDSPLEPVCSLTLGVHSVTPLEMAEAYATLANGGKHCQPVAITTVYDRHGKPLKGFPKTPQKPRPDCEQVVDPDIAWLTVNLLETVVNGSGTGTAANLEGGWPEFGKTGSTNDNGDAWFSGCTAQTCSAVWVGHSEEVLPMSSVSTPFGTYSPVYGGTIPARIWHDFMMVAQQGLPPIDFPGTPVIEWPTEEVPDVVGEEQAEGQRILGEVGFRAIVKMVPSLEKAGIIVAQSPSGGSEATLGTGVTIEVSNGKTPRAKVPSVVSMTEQQATQALEKAGFAVSVAYEKTNQQNLAGIVFAQSPGDGTKAPEGATVTISVYEYEKKDKPPPPPPSPSPSPSPSPTPDDPDDGKGDGKGGGKGGPD